MSEERRSTPGDHSSTITPDRPVRAPPGGGSARRATTPQAAIRVSPYPQRTRTPANSTPARPPAARSVSCESPPVSRRERTHGGVPSVVTTTTSTRDQDLYQLVVQPVLKNTLSQKDATATRFDPFIATGGTFDDILHKLWEKFRSHIEGKAIKTASGWTCEIEVFITDWKHFFHLRCERHPVESGRNEQSWNAWLTTNRNKPIKLIIYKYGCAIGKKDDNDEFLDSCIRPRQRDRAGAAAEEELQDVIQQLQAHWETTFQATAPVWRMWANHVVRDLNRSAWPSTIQAAPPDSIAHMLRPANLPAEARLGQLSHSTHLALECVDGAIEDYAELRQSFVALGRRMELYERRLAARKRCVEAAIQDVRPPAMSTVQDPLLLMENADDVDHEE